MAPHLKFIGLISNFRGSIQQFRSSLDVALDDNVNVELALVAVRDFLILSCYSPREQSSRLTLAAR